jgi:hypothetical protein
LFAPRWAGGWALARLLFAPAASVAHLERFPSIQDALAAPTFTLSSGPARISDHVLLGDAAAWTTWGVGFVGLAGLFYGGRLAKPGLLLWFACHAALLVLLGLNIRAPERMMVFVTLGLLLAPIGERGLTAKARSPVARWYLLVVYGALYGSTGFLKLFVEPAWRAGTALPFDLVDRHHAGGAVAAWLSGQPLLAAIMGWATIALEAGFPLLIAFPRFSPWILAGLAGMHLGIGVLMEVGPLGTLCISMFPVLLDPDVARRFWERIRAAAAAGR